MAGLLQRLRSQAQKWLGVQSLRDELNQLRESVPYIAEYQARTALDKPVIFKGADGLLLECDTLQTYLSFNAKSAALDDPALAKFMHGVLRPDDTVIDLGAHIGEFCLLAGKLVGPGGQVLAVEAETRNYRLLKRNIDLNDQAAWVTVENAAVYSSDGSIELKVFDRGASSWNTIGWFKQDGYEPIMTMSVPSLTLDTLSAKYSIKDVMLLKIDVEGAEPEVIAGGQSFLRSAAIGYLVFEVSQVPLKGMGHTVQHIVAPLSQAGYTIHRICADGMLEPVSIDEMSETFFANFVAIKQDTRGVVRTRH